MKTWFIPRSLISGLLFTLAATLVAVTTPVSVPPLVSTTVSSPGDGLKGDYVEVRSCDVYTGSCVANSEMGLSGREGMLVWSVRDGSWEGVSLQGLNVIAIVSCDDTLGDVRYFPQQGRTVLILDDRADARQARSLEAFARHMAAGLIKDVVAVRTAAMEVELGQCSSGSCARIKAGNLVEISTRCLGSKDHLCGNEDNYYPPLTRVDHPFTAYTELAAYRGPGLGLTWELTGKRSAYLASFSL